MLSRLCLIAVLGLSHAACDGSSRSLTGPTTDAESAALSLKSDHAPEPGRVAGGGQILEDAWRASFAGQARVLGGEPVPIWADGIQFDDVTGHWVIQLHHVSFAPANGSTFRSTRVQRLQFFPNIGQTGCTAGVRVHLEGMLDGAGGWTALVVVVGGADGVHDTARMRLWGPADEYYDTAFDFSSESTCAGAARTNLDDGNVTVRLPG
ncbi:MAG: hypothetical protein M8866_05870 [marine benthic group bacterium]|nr:hypothetical protein [Candidatus Benthicola marisminoris]